MAKVDGLTATMRKGWMLAGIAVLAVLLLAYAWVDAGREPMRTISHTVPVPASAQEGEK
jgi:hypothetical protein